MTAKKCMNFNDDDVVRDWERQREQLRNSWNSISSRENYLEYGRLA